MPVLALTFASGVSLSLVVARILWTGRFHYAFLVWNLCLAWLPLVFALLANDEYRNARKPSWRFCGSTIAWLLFLPNAPYIFTDLIHLTTRFFPQFWVDLTLILLCALTGLVLGFVSLYLMQGVVKRLVGDAASWVFIAAVAGVSGYRGRSSRRSAWFLPD